MSWAEIIVFLSYVDIEDAKKETKVFLDYIKSTSPELDRRVNKNVKIKLIRKPKMFLMMSKLIKRKYNIEQ